MEVSIFILFFYIYSLDVCHNLTVLLTQLILIAGEEQNLSLLILNFVTQVYSVNLLPLLSLKKMSNKYNTFQSAAFFIINISRHRDVSWEGGGPLCPHPAPGPVYIQY